MKQDTNSPQPVPNDIECPVCGAENFKAVVTSAPSGDCNLREAVKHSLKYYRDAAETNGVPRKEVEAVTIALEDILKWNPPTPPHNGWPKHQVQVSAAFYGLVGFATEPKGKWFDRLRDHYIVNLGNALKECGVLSGGPTDGGAK